MENDQNLNEFLKYLVEYGFTYIRIKPGDKRPDGKWSRPEDRITADEVMSRIARGGNYGIVPPEGIFILDFDSDEAYQRSIEKDASIQESLTFKTPRGYHVVFIGEGIEQGASHTFLGQGVDIRAGNKGYVVGPGSIREDGRYEYLSGDEIKEAPESLIKLLQKPQKVEVPGKTPPSAGSPPQAPVGASNAGSEGQRSLTVMERAAASRKHWEALKTAQPGERNDTIARTACGLGSIYADADQEKRDEIFAKLIGHADRLGDGDQAEIQQNRTTAMNQWKEGAKSPAMRDEKPDNSARYRLTFTQFDIQEFEQALSNLNIEIRHNQETDKVELLITDDGSWDIPKAFRFKVGDWFVPDKKTNNTIIGNINRHFGKERGESIIGVSLPEAKFNIWKDTIAGENPIRPFHRWIETPPPFVPFPGLELYNWMNPWLVDRESELNIWGQRAIPIGIVQKAYRDRQACRVIPVLRGEKGIGKTTIVTELIPEDFRCMFGQFQVNSRKAEMVGAIRGKFLCEAGELAGMKDSRVSIFKAFIGNEMNTSRLPYEADFLDYENTAFIVGTSNPEQNVPNDDALRSRLLFMDLQRGPNPKDYLPGRLPHLYALAREAYLAGERVGVLPEELEHDQHESSEESIIVNQVMDVKLRMIDWRQITKWFTIYDIALASGLITLRTIQMPSGAQKAIRDYLKELGVGTSRKDMRKKGPARGWHYSESEEIKKIRAALNKQHGLIQPKYGFGVSKTLSNSSHLF